MATGYTYKLVEQEQSFKDFVLHCSDAFVGRDRFGYPEGSLTPIPFDDYCKRAIDSAEVDLANAQQLTLEQAQQHCDLSYADDLSRYHRKVYKNKVVTQRLQDMLDRVQNWEPPTEDHVALKDFMVEQLKSTIRFESCVLSPPTRMSAETYLQQRRQIAKARLDNAIEDYKKHVERVTKLNRWIEELGKSLENVKD